MSLSEDIQGLSILGEVLISYNQDSGFFQAHIKGVETKNHLHSAILTLFSGRGVTPEAAVRNYKDQLRGKIVVLNAYSPHRKEFIVL